VPWWWGGAGVVYVSHFCLLAVRVRSNRDVNRSNSFYQGVRNSVCTKVTFRRRQRRPSRLLFEESRPNVFVSDQEGMEWTGLDYKNTPETSVPS
jgi:hypothetical protein